MSENLESVLLAKVQNGRQAVTSKWLSDTQKVTADAAKQAMDDVYAKHTSTMNAVFLVTGVASDLSLRIQLVSASNLDAYCASLDRVVSKHVYALSPKPAAPAAAPVPASPVATAALSLGVATADQPSLLSAWSLSVVEQRAQHRGAPGSDILAPNALRTNAHSRITNTTVTRARGAFALPVVTAPPMNIVSNAFDAVAGSALGGRSQSSITAAFAKSTAATTAGGSPGGAALVAAAPARASSASAGGLKGMFALASSSSSSTASPAAVKADPFAPSKDPFATPSASSSKPSNAFTPIPKSTGAATSGAPDSGFGFKLGDDPFANDAPLNAAKGGKRGPAAAGSGSSGKAAAAAKPAAGKGKGKGGKDDMGDFIARDSDSESDSDSDNSSSSSEDEGAFVRRAPTTADEEDEHASAAAAGLSRRTAAATTVDDDDANDYDDRRDRARLQEEQRHKAAALAAGRGDNDDDDDIGRKGKNSARSRVICDDDDDDDTGSGKSKKKVSVRHRTRHLRGIITFEFMLLLMLNSLCFICCISFVLHISSCSRFNIFSVLFLARDHVGRG